ncbi:hypothetical protein SDC9_130075 [bioreactor metagenome]|uniref:Uncharacterized protein n=1 Tax=bioreactor metagenome TaxID=1076179 RepID=A0A645D2P0_9ZZZZ
MDLGSGIEEKREVERIDVSESFEPSDVYFNKPVDYQSVYFFCPNFNYNVRFI